MPVTFAFCSDIEAYHGDRIRDPAVCRNFPGSEWVPEFIKQIEPRGHHLTTGDRALAAIRSGHLAASDTYIISEQDARQASALQQAGARPLAIICFESPLFARTFYQNVCSIVAPYPVRLLFQGTIDAHFPGDPRCFATRIPIVHEHTLGRPIIDWEERQFMAMVAANKYWRTPFQPKFLLTPKYLEAWLRGKFRITNSPVKREAMARQLHDTRLALIEYFGSRGELNLFGRGWLDSTRLPSKWKHLIPLLKRLKPEPCDDKQEVLAQHRFALCLENNRYPGYLTEKIIDCFAAGTIPVYLGDPLVDTVIPTDAFVDLQHFPVTSVLQYFLRSMTAGEGMRRIEAGRRFITSDAAREFTFQGFAAALLQRIQPSLPA